MAPNTPKQNQVPLTENDIEIIDQFRKKKSTAVLTILFTDIKGFTKITEEFGEDYSNKIRKHHDELIVPVIERDGGGRVIKHIGDAIMAVFSEPSTAVTRSLEAQTKLNQFNQENPDLEDIEVRMGLHSGQVTTEDNVSSDVFGRHVNRAARVEALADSGQVLVTYSVFDSARGWLNAKSDNPVEWEKHGQYDLKGIPEPIEIYEAYNPNRTKPKAPAGGKKPGGNSLKLLIAACALIILGAFSTFAYTKFINRAPPEITLVDYNSDWAKLINGQPFHVGGEPGDHIRTALTPLEPGNHLLYADRSQIVRFFAPFDVKSGKNILNMKFERVQLPGISRRVTFSPNEDNTVKVSKDYKFVSYDAEMNRKENTAHIDFTLNVVPDTDNKDLLIFTCDWAITLNDKEISKGTVSAENDINNTETQRSPQKILWSDDYHYYYLSYYTSGSGAEFRVEANFADYKDR